MNILYITTIGGTMSFFKDFIKELIEKGHTVDLACNNDISPISDCFCEWGCKIYNLSCTRKPFDFDNIKTIKEIKSIVYKEKYDIVHCHTPIAAICTRLACCTARLLGVKVIYTVHGFHFYEGASIKNWLLFYPIEWICSWMTDVLITINREDFNRAKKHFHAKKTRYVPGVGVDTQKMNITSFDVEAKKQELGIKESDIVLLSVGELNKNKNHETVILAIAACNHENIQYFICGNGELHSYLSNLIKKLNLESRVHLLGFRTDIQQMLEQTDIFVHPSFREGLPVALMEAMAHGLPVIAGDNRGTKDLIVQGRGGYLVKSDSVDDYKSAIFRLIKDKQKCKRMGDFNINVIRKFDIKKINKLMLTIYLEVWNGKRTRG